MASWMVHLRVADKLMGKIRFVNPTEFIVGNIAPDSGVPNADWSVFTPSTTVSHFKTEKGQNILLICAAVVTIVCHYSTFLYRGLTGGAAMEYLRHNPNLLLPIYPCNVVMWGTLLYGFLKNKTSRVATFGADYLFWFGIFSTLVGMFANVDFILNPTFRDWEVTKSILAHATLLFNILLIFAFGHIKVDLIKNMTHIALSVLMMYGIGIYCNAMFEALASAESAYAVNSMFLLHSPFPALPFLRYPIIAACALVLYFLLFFVWELFAYPKGKRWYQRRQSTTP